jgi:hypothetical protein
MSSDDAISFKRGAGFASLVLIPVEINTALAIPLAFSSGFLSIFSVDLVGFAKISFCFVFDLLFK